jgi:F-type H+-transporting ATPase subunit gamma
MRSQALFRPQSRADDHMGKLQELRARINTIENIRSITRTLATVAAARLSRTRLRAAGLHAYARSYRRILLHQQEYLARRGVALESLASLLRPARRDTPIALLVITADRGMCGSYNVDACRHALAFHEQSRKQAREVTFVVKGRKGRAFLARHGVRIAHHENWPRAGVQPADVERLLRVLLDLYRTHQVGAVYAVYTAFHSPIHREPRVIRMLPVELPAAPVDSAAAGVDRWHYEPALQELIEELVAVYLRVQLYDVLLESYASEHGARMITMEEATERADRALQTCRVQHNRLRREAITTDLLGALYAARSAAEFATRQSAHVEEGVGGGSQ